MGNAITLAGIRALLTEYDAANDAYNLALETTDIEDDRSEFLNRITINAEIMESKAPDYLRALLAVTESAQALIENPDSTHPDWESDSYMGTLKKALAKLKDGN